MNSTPSAYNELDSPGWGEIAIQFIQWFVRGLVQPVYSLPFYRSGLTKGLGWAIFFFLFFSIIQTAYTTGRLAIGISEMPQDLEEIQSSGELRSITIENGIASVDGTQPWIVSDQRTFIGIDVTGEIREIDTSRYDNGILITKTEIHILNTDGEYQKYSLQDVNAAFGDPIVIDEDVMNRAWKTFSSIMLIVVGGVSFVWNFGVRLIYIAVLAAVMWALTQTWRKDAQYSDVFVTGIYVSVPVIYLYWLINLLGPVCLCVHTLILFAGWIIVLRFVLPPIESTPDTPVIADSI